MAEATAVTTVGGTGHCPDGWVYGVGQNGESTITNDMLGDSIGQLHNTASLKFKAIRFSSIANTNTYTSGLRGVVACAWQPDDCTDDDVRAVITDRDNKPNTTDTRGAAKFTFVAGGTRSGWLWVWYTG